MRKTVKAWAFKYGTQWVATNIRRDAIDWAEDYGKAPQDCTITIDVKEKKRGLRNTTTAKSKKTA